MLRRTTALAGGPPMTDSSAPPAAAFRTGDTVAIFRVAPVLRPLIEGRATILAPINRADDLYRVRFAGEAMARSRVVHGGALQSDPDALLRALLARWWATLCPEIFPRLLSDADTFSCPGRV